MTKAIGIDFGGTKVLGGIVDLETGEVVASVKKRTNASDADRRKEAGIPEEARSPPRPSWPGA